ncbi:RtcB family protein [Knoellia koreensis]|uniref:3'-phosphate/5'-hydroxy nucleic acid ligase n=1 Tax=Knoellia koreensis TaxID=2730921 RepID=A0A849HHL8_9MICO|nr:RtcB family protein [Knoellia sp. DB2414S]NNM46712.1 RtcB family protein [Knoellia sp. DB2414S]
MHQINTKLINWASVLEDKTREQALRTSTMPFVFPHLALMPDAHLGLGATVGSVIPTERAVMPAAVGVDIGCGMIAVRTQFTRDDLDGKSLTPLRESIERAIPLSAGAANRKIVATAQPRIGELEAMATKAGFDPDQRAGRWREQLGTLGSGNHFIELSLDEQDGVWAFLHSGSRGVGNKIAQHHIAIARTLMDRHWIQLPDRDLAYLVEGTDEFWAYIRELRWAQHYALLNREEMMDRVLRQLGEFLGTDVQEHERVNCHHNFTQQEDHWGKKGLWVSRKGAIEAREGQPGLIPGSMGTRSYVVEGLGNKVALNSAPHGAGRQFSRSAARKRFTHDELRAAMAGIEFRDTDAFLDEIPAAYKDIDQVMADAADLVTVRHTLRQVVNVKGE